MSLWLPSLALGLYNSVIYKIVTFQEKTNAALTTNKKSEAIDTAASAIVVTTAAVNEDQGIDMTLVPN